MKITDYVSNLTKREAGKEQVTVAQVAEIVKKVNADLWGVPYLLIKLKRKLPKVAAIAALLICGCAPAMAFVFDASKSKGASDYLWDFSDGQTSTEKVCKHDFRDPGIHPVKLVAFNQCGSSTAFVSVVSS